MLKFLLFLLFGVISCFEELPVFMDEDVSNLNGDYCGQKWSCAVQNVDDRNCKCDRLCGLYGDCCKDATTNKTYETVVPKFKCDYIPEVDNYQYVYVIQSCPFGTRQDLSRACEESTSLDSKIPVSGTKTGYLYRNMFCAACHREEFIPWQVGFSCKWRYKSTVNKTLESMQKDEHCSKVFHPPESDNFKVAYKARPCFPFISLCIIKENEEKCINGETELVFDEDVYKNIDCALCNDVNTENFTCSARTWKLRPGKEKRKIQNYSYRLLFDFNTNEATGIYVKHSRTQSRDKNTISCPDKQVYDPFSNVCRQISCLFPLVYNEGRCVYKKAVRNKIDTFAVGNDLKECVYVKLNDTEYEIINKTNIFIYSTNKTLRNDVFYHAGNYTYVCDDEISNVDKHIYNTRDSESVLTLVGSVLSITALTITLLLYLRFPKLRNTPGKSLICLMFSLIVAQVLFLFANEVEDYRHVCLGFAVIIHYAFLASVFWMNCMSFDIFITFSKGFVKSDEDKSQKTFIYYSVYAWLVPLLIVVSGIFLDALTMNEYRPMYGEIICWMGNKRAILVYFVIPIGLVVTANLFFYVFTVRYIFRSDRQTNRILRRKKSCKLLVYVKLSVVMGLTWVFAYIASFSDELVFWYFFIFLNSWQGVFIFISFVCFGKVRTHVVDRVRVVSSYFLSRTQTSTLTDSTKR